jgi:rRNA maturation endonuclease Nob1
MVRCENCGKENDKDAAFCEKCGANLKTRFSRED